MKLCQLEIFFVFPKKFSVVFFFLLLLIVEARPLIITRLRMKMFTHRVFMTYLTIPILIIQLSHHKDFMSDP